MIRVCKGWLRAFRWADEAVVRTGSVFVVGKRGAGRDFCLGGRSGGGACHVNQQNHFGGEDFDMERPVMLGMCTKYVICLKKYNFN